MPGLQTRSVLVLGDNDLAGLAIVRSLGRAGLCVHVASWQEKKATCKSRYTRRIIDTVSPSADPNTFQKQILDAAKEGNYDLIIPISDNSLIPLMSVREEINEYAALVAPDKKGFEATNDKAVTMRLAQELDIPIPSTTLINSRAELERIKLPSEFPVVLKPTRSMVEGGDKRYSVRVVRSLNELEQRLPEMVEQIPVLVQSYCSGKGVGINILASEGEILAAFQHQRVHEPPEGGASSYRKSVPLSSALLDLVGQFCKKVAWTGPAMFEFKLDEENDKAVLMEVNGRFWGSLALAIQAGVDFPRLVYDLLVLGKKQKVFDYKTPYYVRHTVRDVPWYFANFRTPKGRKDLLKVSWWDVMKEAGNIITLREGYDLEWVSDPMPALYTWKGLFKDVYIQISGKLDSARYRRLANTAKKRLSSLGPSSLFSSSHTPSVLFICYGNINRSAFAERVMKQLYDSESPVKIGSSGFHHREGRPTTKPSLQVARSMGIDLSSHKSSTLTKDILEKYDLVLVMESNQLEKINQINPAALQKTFLLSFFGKEGTELDIQDPYGKDPVEYERIYTCIHCCVNGLVDWLKSDRNHN